MWTVKGRKSARGLRRWKLIFGSWQGEWFGAGKFVCSFFFLILISCTEQELWRLHHQFSFFFVFIWQNSSIFTYIQIASSSSLVMATATAPSSPSSATRYVTESNEIRKHFFNVYRSFFLPLLFHYWCLFSAPSLFINIPEEIKKIFALSEENFRPGSIENVIFHLFPYRSHHQPVRAQTVKRSVIAFASEWKSCLTMAFTWSWTAATWVNKFSLY